MRRVSNGMGLCGFWVRRVAAALLLLGMVPSVVFPLPGSKELLDRANALYKKGDYAGAAELYRKVIEISPGSFTAHYNLGFSLRKKGDLAGAAESFREAVKIRPEDAKAHFHLGYTLEKLNDVDGAEEHYRRSVELDPNNSDVYFYLAGVLKKKGDTEGAVENYRMALEINPNNYAVLYNLGLTLFYDGDAKGAIEMFNRALELAPHALLYVNLGLAYLSEAKVQSAIENYRKALELDPRNFYALFNLGDALLKLGKNREAAKYLRKAIERNPDEITPYNRLGEALAAMGDREGAVENFLAVLERRPGNVPAKMSLLKVTGKGRRPPKLEAEAEFREPSGNGVLDPGEEGSIEVTVENAGEGSAHLVRGMATVLGDVSGVSVGTSTTVRILEPGSTARIRIPVTAGDGLKDGEVRFRIEIEEANDFNPEAPLEVTVRTGGS